MKATSSDIHILCAEALYMFEGMAQGGLGANWGDGHATDASLMSQVRNAPRSSPVSCFISVLMRSLL